MAFSSVVSYLWYNNKIELEGCIDEASQFKTAKRLQAKRLVTPLF